MAFSFKITGIPRDTGMPVWTVDMLNWWDWGQIRQDIPFRKIIQDGYIDEVAVVTREEALDLHERYRARANQWQQDDVVRLSEFLSCKPPETCFILLNVYEWESGLG